MIRKNLQILHLIEQLASASTTKESIIQRHFDAGQRIIQQDQHIQSVYIIQSGIAKCFITEDNDKDYILEFLGEGEVVGDLEAIRQERTICSIEAITPLSCYVMSHAQFVYFLRSLPDFNTLIIELLATRIANSSIKGARQQLHSLADILPRLLKELNTQHISFSKQELADYMGISVRSLNRLLKDSGTTNN